MKTKQRHFKKVGLLLVSLLLLISASSPSKAYERDEKIKAAYLFRLSLFVDWPTESTPTEYNNVVFCIAENQQFYQLVEQTIRTKTINQKPVTTSLVDLDTDLSNCHILYIPDSVEKPDDYLNLIIDKPVLTIGESKKFYRNGGMIYLFEKDNRMRFIIDQSVVEKNGLKIRAQLLKLAITP